jgi:hypothetical protein
MQLLLLEIDWPWVLTTVGASAVGQANTNNSSFGVFNA